MTDAVYIYFYINDLKKTGIFSLFIYLLEELEYADLNPLQRSKFSFEKKKKKKKGNGCL